jgi:hypothetical protein
MALSMLMAWPCLHAGTALSTTLYLFTPLQPSILRSHPGSNPSSSRPDAAELIPASRNRARSVRIAERADEASQLATRVRSWLEHNSQLCRCRHGGPSVQGPRRTCLPAVAALRDVMMGTAEWAPLGVPHPHPSPRSPSAGQDRGVGHRKAGVGVFSFVASRGTSAACRRWSSEAVSGPRMRPVRLWLGRACAASLCSYDCAQLLPC